MFDELKNLKPLYALNSDNELVSIQKIRDSGLRGLACNCRCLICKEPLEARIGEGIRAPYFAHSKHSNCSGATMTFLHMLSILLIEKHKNVMAPHYYSIPSRKLEFIDVEVEKREDRNDMQPDIVGITPDGKRWAIEIRNTHKVGAEKRKKINESGIACIEIDVSKQSVETLEDFLFNQTDDRKWINNPYDDELLPKPKSNFQKETPVPDYIYNPKRNRVQKKEYYSLKIPDSCHNLTDYYTYLKSRKSFFIDGRRHNILEVAYSPVCKQLVIFHNDSSTFSYNYVTGVYEDSEGNMFETTGKCRRDEFLTILDAIKKDWLIKAEELKDKESLPFPKQDDNNLPF